MRRRRTTALSRGRLLHTMRGKRGSRVSMAGLPVIGLLAIGLLPAGSGVAAQNETAGSGAKTWIGRQTEIEDYIREAEIVKIEAIGRGVTNPSRADFSPGGVVEVIAWKPIQPGRYEGRFESYKFEIAAYELDKLLGLNLVPVTVERRIEGERGAAVMWIESATNFRELGGLPRAPPAKRAMWNRQIVQAKMFDNLIGNRDPNLGNWLVDSEWNLFLIDHSRAFSRSARAVHEMTRFDRELFSKMNALDDATLERATDDWLTKKERLMILKRVELMRAEVQTRIDQSSEEAVFLPSR